jgi:hypothetical protein
MYEVRKDEFILNRERSLLFEYVAPMTRSAASQDGLKPAFKTRHRTLG